MSQGLESQKQDFKTYLIKSGAIQQVSKVMLKMFDEPEKPSQALKYILEYLGVPESENPDTLLKEFEAEQLQNLRLRREITKIKKQIEEIKDL